MGFGCGLFLLLMRVPFSFFSGFKNKDVAFFHPESKTLIEADLLFNLPAKEQVCFTRINIV
jgi:hypothetical protein